PYAWLLETGDAGGFAHPAVRSGDVHTMTATTAQREPTKRGDRRSHDRKRLVARFHALQGEANDARAIVRGVLDELRSHIGDHDHHRQSLFELARVARGIETAARELREDCERCRAWGPEAGRARSPGATSDKRTASGSIVSVSAYAHGNLDRAAPHAATSPSTLALRRQRSPQYRAFRPRSSGISAPHSRHGR